MRVAYYSKRFDENSPQYSAEAEQIYGNLQNFSKVARYFSRCPEYGFEEDWREADFLQRFSGTRLRVSNVRLCVLHFQAAADAGLRRFARRGIVFALGKR